MRNSRLQFRVLFEERWGGAEEGAGGARPIGKFRDGKEIQQQKPHDKLPDKLLAV